MYVNYGGWLLNDQRHYAFLRKKDDDLLLIVANFDENNARVGVRIPEHAFQYLGIESHQEIEGVDLLSGHVSKYQLLPDKICTIEVAANNAAIVKFQL